MLTGQVKIVLFTYCIQLTLKGLAYVFVTLNEVKCGESLGLLNPCFKLFATFSLHTKYILYNNCVFSAISISWSKIMNKIQCFQMHYCENTFLVPKHE